VAELGEDAVLAAILPLLPSSTSVVIGPGDDSAGVRGEGVFLLTTDTMVAGRDFRLEWSSAADLGRKAVASNFADIAAMGASASALLVALTLPPNTKFDWVLEFAAGLATGISRLNPGAGVIGGDLALGDQLHIAITAVGSLAEGQAVTRSGARSGDRVAIAGGQGRSAAGLELLVRGLRGSGESQVNPTLIGELIAAHLTPEPPIMLGETARLAGASAMLDVSDGLVRDAGRISKASSVSIDLSSAKLEQFVSPLLAAAKLLEPDPARAMLLARDWVYQGGEDHCLLATFPGDVAVPEGFELIGLVTSARESLVLLDGEPISPAGWDSLSSR
jgi:thiamine-monophosphate kinase